MSHDPWHARAAAAALAGLGIDELSMSPHDIPKIKEYLQSVTQAQATAAAQAAQQPSYAPG